MRVIFAGTPVVAIPTLEALLSSEHEVVAVLTRTDAPVGRKAVLTPSPVAEFAERHSLNIIKANSIDETIASVLAELKADLGVVVAYGAFLPQATLDATTHGWINLHFSPLPRLRGAAPLQHTLIEGQLLAHTCVFKLVKAMDAGPIASVEAHQLTGSETATNLLAQLSIAGATQTLHVIDDIENGTVVWTEQKGEPTFANKLTTQDAFLDPSLDGPALFNRFRGVTTEPGAWLLDGELRVKVLDAAPSSLTLNPAAIELLDGRVFYGTSTTALELISVQPAGKSKMSAADWARGRR
ncbi:MAG: Methionyl-tRNA formyltransferase [Actinomycetota bacterium]